jgi:3-hydroxyisobutyrate dehydrogenase-like beta-hydroxyacid dehydrogenase
VPAETGTLIFLCGGDAAVFESQAAYLGAMGKVGALWHCFLSRYQPQL